MSVLGRFPDPDAELVRSFVQEGQNQAFRSLYERYKDKVFNTAYRIIGDFGYAADATQEVFIKMHQELSKFKYQSTFSSWLFRMAVNLSIDHARKAQRSPSQSLTNIETEMIKQEGTESKKTFKVENETRVNQAINKLNPELKTVIVLRYLEQLSYEEIAEI